MVKEGAFDEKSGDTKMISEKERELLRSVPEVKELLDSIPLNPEAVRNLDSGRKDDIVSLLLDKLSSAGLRIDGEPNELGKAIESLIDIFNTE